MVAFFGFFLFFWRAFFPRDDKGLDTVFDDRGKEVNVAKISFPQYNVIIDIDVWLFDAWFDLGVFGRGIVINVWLMI